MYANNEIGSIQPIAEIAKILRKHQAVLHTDAVQAPTYLDLNTAKLGVYLMTLNGSKIYGPKGVGLLYLKRGVKIEPLIYGGGQEMGFRPGTENVPAIIGFARALELVQKDKEKESERLTKLRDYFIEEILKKIPDSALNGPQENRLPNNVNISFKCVEGEAIVLYLDAKGVACSTGSACSSDSLDPSHVIMALGVPYEYAHGSARFTLGKKTQKQDIDYVLKVLPGIIKKLRSISAMRK
jgi:cysteine desulfurase